MNKFNLVRSVLLSILSTVFARKDDGLFYILLWTSSQVPPLSYFRPGTRTFEDRGCPYQNCYVTNNRRYLSSITEFDAVLFNVLSLRKDGIPIKLPRSRSYHQKYVLVSRDAAFDCPVSADFNDVFNWTWTYKLNSDIDWSFMVIRNGAKQIIGPRVRMNWMQKDKMKPQRRVLIEKLERKRSAAVWLVSNCETLRIHERWVGLLNDSLSEYDMQVDVFGGCGSQRCPRPNDIDSCLQLVEANYFFYLALENVFSEDFVSQKLLIPLQHIAVPVVLGGADYSRFMPNGIYIDAYGLSPAEVAYKMKSIISHPSTYHDMFRWRRYYTYHSPSEVATTNRICNICTALNNDKKRTRLSQYKNIVQWYNGRNSWYLKN